MGDIKAPRAPRTPKPAVLEIPSLPVDPKMVAMLEKATPIIGELYKVIINQDLNKTHAGMIVKMLAVDLDIVANPTSAA